MILINSKPQYNKIINYENDRFKRTYTLDKCLTMKYIKHQYNAVGKRARSKISNMVEKEVPTLDFPEKPNSTTIHR